MNRYGPNIALFLALTAGCFAQALAPYEPATGCYIGAYIEMDPVVKDDVPRFETLTGRKHASYFHYVGYGQPFPFQWADSLKRIGATPHIAWEPNDGLDAVKDDEYLRGWVQACAHYGGPILLRFASEMNGDWEAWSGDPDRFIDKWRLVYDAFHQAAPNVILIWCPFATPKSTIPLYYPGNDYVDWVGVNVYSVVHHSGDVAKRAVDNAVQHVAFIYNLYAEHKPIAICEYAATHYCDASSSRTVDFAIREMKRMYQSIETRFPRVRLINWFSVDAVREGLAHNDYALTTCPPVLEAYRALVSPAHFLGRMLDTPTGPGGPAIALPAAAFPPLAGGPAVGPRPATFPRPSAVGAVLPVPPPAPSTTHPLAHPGIVTAGPNEVAIVVKGGNPAALTGRVNVEAIMGAALRPVRVRLELDGRFRAMSTTPAYFFPWNTDRATPGEHQITAIVTGPGGTVLAEAQVSVIVADRP